MIAQFSGSKIDEAYGGDLVAGGTSDRQRWCQKVPAERPAFVVIFGPLWQPNAEGLDLGF